MVYDYLVIGAGISGAAAAYELAGSGSTIIVEAESAPGFHSTGRSAALYTPNYGNELVCSINRLAHAFLDSPPAGFTRTPLLHPRGFLSIASNEHTQQLDELVAAGADMVERLDAKQVMALAPFLRPEKVLGGCFERDVFDMDVDAMHQGFLQGFKQRGGELLVSSRISVMNRSATGWDVHAGNTLVKARVVVNAAGAWADEIASLAGARRVSLQPKRRTAILVDAPEGTHTDNVPALEFLGVDNYIKPQSGHLMVSPGDATPVDAQDIQPDDMDVAVLVDWLETETSVQVSRLNHQWAGLRSFVSDNSPIVGFDDSVPDFFWLAGQGGYGIMMASPLGRAAASLIAKHKLPDDFVNAGIDEKSMSASRCRH